MSNNDKTETGSPDIIEDIIPGKNKNNNHTGTLNQIIIINSHLISIMMKNNPLDLSVRLYKNLTKV